MILFLLKEDPPADHTIKNAAGFLAYDIAYNNDVQSLLKELIGMQGDDMLRSHEESKH